MYPEVSRHYEYCSRIGAIAAIGFGALAASAQETPAAGLGEAVARPNIIQTPAGAVEVEMFDAAPSPGFEAPSSSATELEQKIAQLLIVTLQGIYRSHPSDRDLFYEIPPGGVIIRSVARPTHAAEYIASLRNLQIEKTTGVPMFIGANVYALTQGDDLSEQTFMQLPSMLSVVAADDPVLTQNLARRVAQQLRIMGFNLHLGPSIALAPSLSEAEGSIHNFGSDPARVGATGTAFFQALQSEGIIAAAMGFPGGGGNRVGNTPAVLVTPAQQLESRDLAPYANAVKSGVKMVHVGTTIVPTLDKAMRPACQSPLVLEGLLRYRLGFEGIILAGPIDHADLRARQTPGEAAIASLRAGADMLYMQTSGRQAMKVVQDVAKAVNAGTLDEAQIDRAFDRVVAFKTKEGLADRPAPDEKAAEGLEQSKTNYDETYWIERQAITVVQNNEGILPLSKTASMPIGVTGVAGVSDLHDALEEYIKKIAEYSISTARHIRRVQDFEIERVAKGVHGMRTAVIVLTSDLPHHGQAELITAVQEKGVRVVAVLLGYPEYVPYFRHADAIVCAYSSGANIGETMRAVADILAGNAPITILPAMKELRRSVGQAIPFDVKDVIRCPAGRLPVSIGPGYEAGMAASYDPAASLKQVEWDFGDGKRAKQHRVEHAYLAAGKYDVKLSVIDSQNRASTGTFPIVVE